MTKRILSFVLFFLPLVYFKDAHQMFELPKFAFFLFFGCGLMSLSLAWEYWRGKIQLKDTLFMQIPRYIVGLFLLLFCCVSISTVFSAFPEMSFWGSYLRHDGLLLFISLYTFLSLLLLQPWNREELLEMLYWVMAGAFAAAGAGLVQKIFPDFIVSTASTYGRVSGTLGHPNFLGQYLVGTSLLSLGIFAYYFSQKRFQWEHLIAAGVMFFGLLATWNRASLVALGCALFLGMVSFMWIHQFRKRKPVLVFVSLFLSFVLFAVSFLSHGTSEQGLRSVETRWTMLPPVLSMISNSWVFGYGPDMFNTAITKYYPKQLMETETLTSIPDRAHNIILDIVSDVGCLGLLMYLLILIVLLQSTRHAWKNAHKEEKLLLSTVWLAVSGMMFSYIAGFAVIEHKVLFTFLIFVLLFLLYGTPAQQSQRGLRHLTSNFLKLVGTYTQKLSTFLPVAFRERATTTHQKPTIHVGITLILLVIGVFFFVTGMRLFAADVWYERALSSGQADLYERALNLNPFPYEYLLFSPQQLENTDARTTFLKDTKTANPDYYFYLQQARLYQQKQSYKDAHTSFYHAASLCPECLQTYYYWYLSARDAGDADLERRTVHAFFSLVPSFLLKTSDSLTESEKDRKRILMKEQGTMLRTMSDASYLLELEYRIE